MSQSTASIPLADQQAIARATAAAQAAEQARITRLHQEAAADYQAGQAYRNANNHREG